MNETISKRITPTRTTEDAITHSLPWHSFCSLGRIRFSSFERLTCRSPKLQSYSFQFFRCLDSFRNHLRKSRVKHEHWSGLPVRSTVRFEILAMAVLVSPPSWSRRFRDKSKHGQIFHVSELKIDQVAWHFGLDQCVPFLAGGRKSLEAGFLCCCKTGPAQWGSPTYELGLQLQSHLPAACPGCCLQEVACPKTIQSAFQFRV